ncbi:MAG: flagellin lysine-N-methylase [Eubacteriales bacterium]
MKLRAPEYYKEFQCIAGRCRHSCCIGWEICIDEGALEKYRGTDIERSISRDGVPHLVMIDGNRCPHLDERGLCRIIAERGEGYLCDICREHPRFYHDTEQGREVGIGLSCEEACRLILSSDGYARFVELADVDGEPSVGFDALPLRAKIFGILSSDAPYGERLDRISTEFSVFPLPNDSARELLAGLEYLEPWHGELFLSYDVRKKCELSLEKKLERALAYFVFRHCSDACDGDDFRSSLGFALFCERLIACIGADGDIEEAARIVSEELEYSEENTEAIKFEYLF